VAGGVQDEQLPLTADNGCTSGNGGRSQQSELTGLDLIRRLRRHRHRTAPLALLRRC
jgi:hypothetical protein